jgi:hypothetical protein
MNDEDPFESPKLLLERAQEHLAELQRREKVFFGRQPYARIVEPDTDPRYEVHKLRFTAKVPGSYSTVVSDALNNIRHTLDQTVVASARALGATKVGHIYFPVCDVESQLEGAIRKKCEGVHPDVVDFIRKQKPYRGGDPIIALLSKLAGSNKHQMLAPIGAMSNGIITIPGGWNPADADNFLPMPHWDGAKNELTLARIRRGYKAPHNLQVRFEIAFNDPDAQIEAPVISFLDIAGLFVSTILANIEMITLKAKASNQ